MEPPLDYHEQQLWERKLRGSQALHEKAYHCLDLELVDWSMFLHYFYFAHHHLNHLKVCLVEFSQHCDCSQLPLADPQHHLQKQKKDSCNAWFLYEELEHSPYGASYSIGQIKYVKKKSFHHLAVFRMLSCMTIIGSMLKPHQIQNHWDSEAWCHFYSKQCLPFHVMGVQGNTHTIFMASIAFLIFSFLLLLRSMRMQSRWFQIRTQMTDVSNQMYFLQFSPSNPAWMCYNLTSGYILFKSSTMQRMSTKRMSRQRNVVRQWEPNFCTRKIAICCLNLATCKTE